jgi:glycosyltransferase involved in cell wall biosynthesis
MTSSENRSSKTKWIFIHLGARAHYQFPEAVSDKIHLLYTDVWVPVNLMTRILSELPFPSIKKILQRNHTKIDNSKVVAFPVSLLLHELLWKIKGIKGWEKIIRRNNWFQDKVKNHLLKNVSKEKYIVFTFAYTAYEILLLARSKGWKTMLYQMDPGLEEEEIVKKELDGSALKSSWEPAPVIYWNQWKEELKLTDKIIVNSLWSKSALIKANAPEEKIRVSPLALEENIEAKAFHKDYPEKFSEERPLKVLFLGILTLRKGLRPLMGAIELLKNEPVEFTFVGTPETQIPENPKVKVVPSVSRAETAMYYKIADVFLFPTLSDGFGLTQLEALSWKLPVISSKFCGDVIQNNINGIVLEEVTAGQISKAVLKCLSDPSILNKFSKNTSDRVQEFSLTHLGEELMKISE